MRENSENALAAALAAREHGSSIDESLRLGLSTSAALGDDPESVAELRAELLVAELLATGPHPAPDPRYRREAKARILAVARRSHRRPPTPLRAWATARLAPRARPFAAALALAFLVAGIGGTLGVTASAAPGEPLYSTKLAVENVQIAVAPTESQRTQLHLTFANRRLDELEVEAQSGDYDAVDELAQLYHEQLKAAVSANSGSEPESEHLREHAGRAAEIVQRVVGTAPAPAAERLRKSAQLLGESEATPTATGGASTPTHGSAKPTAGEAIGDTDEEHAEASATAAAGTRPRATPSQPAATPTRSAAELMPVHPAREVSSSQSVPAAIPTRQADGKESGRPAATDRPDDSASPARVATATPRPQAVSPTPTRYQPADRSPRPPERAQPIATPAKHGSGDENKPSPTPLPTVKTAKEQPSKATPAPAKQSTVTPEPTPSDNEKSTARSSPSPSKPGDSQPKPNSPTSKPGDD